MRDNSGIGFYAAAKANINKAGLVGLEGIVEFSVTDFAFDLNIGISDSGTVVDFSKSGEDGGAYTIDTGSPENSISFDYDEALLAVQGQVHIGILGAVNLDGYLNLELTTDSLLLQVAMEASFAFGGFKGMSANGTLVIEGGDIYGSMLVQGTGSNGAIVESSFFSIGGSFFLASAGG